MRIGPIRFMQIILMAVLLSAPVMAADQMGAVSGTEGIRAKLIPVSSTILSSELSGSIATLNVREGDSFKKGDVLASFNCTLHDARLAKAEAQVVEARKTHESSARLAKLGSTSNLETDVSAARLAAAEADAALAKGIVERCRITAPFSGKVAALEVKRYQYVGEGQKLMEILDDHQLEVEMIVPSRWLAWLRRNSAFSLQVDETGKSYGGRIDRIAPSIDPVSQSVKVFGKIEGSSPDLMSGMSGTIRFEQGEAKDGSDSRGKDAPKKVAN